VESRNSGIWAPFDDVAFRVTDMARPMPRSYKAKVSLLRGGEPVEAGIIEVNKPMRFEGFWIYQVSCDDQDWSYTVVDVVHDPGIGFVFLGLAVIMAGSFVLLYVEPLLRWWGRREA